MFILYCLGAEVIMRLKKGLQGAKRGAARRVCGCWVKSDGSGLACDTRSAMRSRVAGAYELSLVVLNNRLLPLISCLIFLAESRVFWMGSICQTSAQAKKTFPTRAVREKKLVKLEYCDSRPPALQVTCASGGWWNRTFNRFQEVSSPLWVLFSLVLVLRGVRVRFEG